MQGLPPGEKARSISLIILKNMLQRFTAKFCGLKIAAEFSVCAL
jgi:hypothetical protein